jgi:hypothetical protein
MKHSLTFYPVSSSSKSPSKVLLSQCNSVSSIFVEFKLFDRDLNHLVNPGFDLLGPDVERFFNSAILVDAIGTFDEAKIIETYSLLNSTFLEVKLFMNNILNIK